jgi:hypothetical protein
MRLSLCLFASLLATAGCDYPRGATERRVPIGPFVPVEHDWTAVKEALKATEVELYDSNLEGGSITQTLIEMKASVKGGKLFDADGRELYFLWQPKHTDRSTEFAEQMARMNKEKDKLEKSYHVVVVRAR